MSSISTKSILRQLRADLIGKDSYRGVTFSYTWLANQFGHFSLGFIPTLVIYDLFTNAFDKEAAAFYSAVLISVGWLLFETYNFLGPLLLEKEPNAGTSPTSGSRYAFQPAWENVAFDTITDLLFFWTGAFSACRLFTGSAIVVVMLLLFTVSLIYPCRYWYLTKMYLQIPQYPFQFRLSQWRSGAVTKGTKDTVSRFLHSDARGRHLLIYGSKGSGKTSLSIGIATEFSIKHTPCVYTTAMKLYCMFFEKEERHLSDHLWDWRTASLLVIDDINPGYPVREEVMSPELFLKLLDAYGANRDNRQVIRSSNMIWVLGNRVSEDRGPDKWEAMLKDIGVAEENILTLCLPDQFN